MGDFYGSGRDDIVWRNTANGTNTIWRGADPAQAYNITPVGGIAWRIVP